MNFHERKRSQQYIMDNIYIILKFHQILSMKLGSATISLIRIFQIYFMMFIHGI